MLKASAICAGWRCHCRVSRQRWPWPRSCGRRRAEAPPHRRHGSASPSRLGHQGLTMVAAGTGRRGRHRPVGRYGPNLWRRRQVSRQLLLTVLVFVVALGSGAVIGWNLPHHRNSPRPQERSWLADELKLTSDQREKMRSIWSAMLPEGQGRQGRHNDTRRQLIRERDEGIAALIPAEKKADYEKVLAHFQQQEEEMSREREKAFAKAVEQTKLILNPEQRVKYEQTAEGGTLRFAQIRNESVVNAAGSEIGVQCSKHLHLKGELDDSTQDSLDVLCLALGMARRIGHLRDGAAERRRRRCDPWRPGAIPCSHHPWGSWRMRWA